MAHAGGRPTKLSQALIDAAARHVDEFDVSTATLLPTIEGLALELNISRDTVYDWEKVPEATDNNAEDVELHLQFSYIVSNLRSKQAYKLIQNSLVNRYNPTIAKLILSGKHGYIEKSEVDQKLTGNVAFINDVPRPKNTK